ARTGPAALARRDALRRHRADDPDRDPCPVLRISHHLWNQYGVFGRTAALCGSALPIQPDHGHSGGLPLWFLCRADAYGVIGISAVISVIVLIVGWVVFARMERSVLKEI